MLIVFIGILAFATTFLGGFFALKFKDKLHLITGFSAGAVIGVAFFDLLPEAANLRNIGEDFSFVSLMIGLGFVVYLLLDRLIVLHSHAEDNCENINHRGALGAASLSLHSFLDGVIIGLAFQISSAIGLVVTIAVLTHDFSDGINTVNLVLKNNGGNKTAIRWLILDALAPVLGILSTFFYSLPKNTLSIVLAIFCGCFIYIGASDLLPESHHAHPKKLTTFMTLLGIALLYIVIQIAK
ncbi:MAG: ZIP family metal transporter [Patescibacteria group bacterium]